MPDAPAMSWMATALLAVMNVYVGRLIALKGRPRGAVGRRSWKAAVFFLFLGGLGLFLLACSRDGRIELTVHQAAVIGGCGLFSYLVFSRLYGRPREPMDLHLNQHLRAILGLCERHGWDLQSREQAIEIAEADGFHFDEEDYWILMERWSPEIQRIRTQGHFPLRPDGEVDYDRVCAEEIVTFANSLVGFKEHPGLIAQMAEDAPLSDLDRPALQRFLWLAGGVRAQWGLPEIARF